MIPMAGPAAPTVLLTLLILLGEGANGLQVYDCDGPNTTYQVISMLEPESCPDPEKDYEDPRLEVVQVLQSQEEANVTAYRCLIKRTIRVTRCRFTSIMYGSHIVEWRNTLAMTKEDCRRPNKLSWAEKGKRGRSLSYVVDL